MDTNQRQLVTDFEPVVTGTQRADAPGMYVDVTIEHALTGHGVKSGAVERAITEKKHCSVLAMMGPGVSATTEHWVIGKDATC